MSRANIDIVTRMVYENLGITEGEYGTYENNERYPLGYVLDNIAAADLNVMKTLLKSKQYHFTSEFFTQVNIPSGAPVTLPSNIELLNVRFYNGNYEERGVEIPWEMYEMFTEPLEGTSLFEFEGDSSKNYGGYFSIKDHYLHSIPFSGPGYVLSGTPIDFVFAPKLVDDAEVGKLFSKTSHGLQTGDVVVIQTTGFLPEPLLTETTYYVIRRTASTFELTLDSDASSSSPTVTPITAGTGNHYVVKVDVQSNVGFCRYISLSHPETLLDESDNVDFTLQSPQSFEEAIAVLASANLLMKRANNPEQAGFYMQQYQMLMGLYMSPSTNQSRTIDQ